ncbi:hypothetical protein ABT369_52485 [Dactylosporangium sp. NPDC000244]|uniref:hypothetical protein n=1 Tax=Dactylosporangium sp. NPDC000244 TaxID=3154365 RepID=UPI003332D46E
MELSTPYAVVDVFPGDAAVPARGDVVRVAPNHVWAAVNLADEPIAVSGGRVAGRRPVAARNAST